MAELSDKARKLFEDPNILFVATVNSDGSPQVTPVWTHVEDGRVTFNTAKGRVKERNMRRDPRIGLSITARDNPMDKVDLAGRVVEMIEGDDGRGADRRPVGEVHRAAPVPVAPGRGAHQGRGRARSRPRDVSLLYLTREDVAGLLPSVSDQLDLVEETYRAVGAGRVELPPKPGIHPRPDSFIHAMPAYLRDDDVAALKWVAGYPANKERGLPYITGLIVLNDPETGVPAAIMDGAEITAARTAAASGVCIRRFAPEDWSRAAVLGAGEQGRFHAQVLRELNSEVAIRAWDPHPERIGSLGDRVEGAAGPREAVEEADIVVTAGPIVEEPDSPLTPDWLAERSLGLPIDFDFYFSADAVASAELFLVDDVSQFDYYRSLGHFQGWPEPEGSVGEALARDGTPERVVCCNLGIGALDAAFAARVLAAARDRGIGTELPL